MAHKGALQGDNVKGGPQVGGSATSPLRSRGSTKKGTKSKVAHKWAEMHMHPCFLRGPQTRGQSQRWPTNGRKCYITPVFLGVPKQEDKVKGGPQKSGSATSPLRSRGLPNKGEKSKVAHKWAEVGRQPRVLGGRKTRRQRQKWPTKGRQCYITPTFSGVPKQGDKVKGPPSGQKCYTTPVFPGVTIQGDKVKDGPYVRKWANVLHHPSVLGFPQKRGESQRRPTSGRNCYITPSSRGSPNKGTK